MKSDITIIFLCVSVFIFLISTQSIAPQPYSTIQAASHNQYAITEYYLQINIPFIHPSNMTIELDFPHDFNLPPTCGPVFLMNPEDIFTRLDCQRKHLSKYQIRFETNISGAYYFIFHGIKNPETNLSMQLNLTLTKDGETASHYIETLGPLNISPLGNLM